MITGFKELCGVLIPGEEHNQQLIAQFYLSLDANLQRLRPGGEELEPHKERIARIESLLQEPMEWRNAYRIEQLLIPLFSGEHLSIELERRFAEARRHLNTEYIKLYQQRFDEAEKAQDPERQRALLSRIVNDLQWHYEVDQARHYYDTRLRVRTALAFEVSFLLFFLPFMLPWLSDLFNVHQGEKSFYVLTALSAGWMGAAFSMLLRMKDRVESSNLDTLKIISRYSNIFSRVVIGMGAGLIFFYLLESGVVSGTLTPSFIYPDTSAGAGKAMQMLETDHALLVIWCFIAGFSEKLVPHVLSKTAERASKGLDK